MSSNFVGPIVVGKITTFQIRGCSNSSIQVMSTNNNSSADSNDSLPAKALELLGVVGLTDAEGCFRIIINLEEGTTPDFEFVIALHNDDKGCLVKVKSVIECGTIYPQKTEYKHHLSVFRHDDIQKIISIFDKFPLNTTKRLNFLMFKAAFEAYMEYKSNPRAYSTEDRYNLFAYINNLKLQMNSRRTDFTYTADHKITITWYWLLKFVEGDGSFCVTTQGITYYPILSIKQATIDKAVLDSIQQFLLDLPGADSVSNHNVIVAVRTEKVPKNPDHKQLSSLSCMNVDFLIDVVIPELDKLPFWSKKYKDYLDWKLIIFLQNRGWTHCPEAREVIDYIINNMNDGRLTNTKIPRLPKPINFEAKLVYYLENSNYKAHPGNKLFIRSSNEYLPAYGKLVIEVIDQNGALVKRFYRIARAAKEYNVTPRVMAYKIDNKVPLFVHGKPCTVIKTLRLIDHPQLLYPMSDHIKNLNFKIDKN